MDRVRIEENSFKPFWNLMNGWIYVVMSLYRNAKIKIKDIFLDLI